MAKAPEIAPENDGKQVVVFEPAVTDDGLDVYTRIAGPFKSVRDARRWLTDSGGNLHGKQVVIASLLKPVTVKVQQVAKVTLA